MRNWTSASFLCQIALRSQRCICLHRGSSAMWPLNRELKKKSCLKSAYFQNIWKSGLVTLKCWGPSIGRIVGKQTWHWALHMASNLTWRDRFPKGREKHSICFPRSSLSGAALPISDKRYVVRPWYKELPEFGGFRNYSLKQEEHSSLEHSSFLCVVVTW